MAKITLRSEIVNDKYTEYLYKHYDIQTKDYTATDVPLIPQDDWDKMNNGEWNILLICGKSGSGKSTLLKEIGTPPKLEYDYTKAVVSQFPNLDEEEVCDLLCGVGLSSVPTWLRKPQELSNGERARLDLCMSLYRAREAGIALIDEFSSVVNRDVAKSMSYALQRYVRQKKLKVVICSCHFDIIEWLTPDYIFNLEHKDKDGNVELERMVYADDTDYNVYQSVTWEESLSEPMDVKFEG